MANKPDRVILDTNLWISFLITRDFSKLDRLIPHHKVKLIFSSALIEEFISVTERPKLRKFFSKGNSSALLETLDQYSELVTVTSTISKCRDHKDNFLLALAVDGNADYLLTGDSDLLVLKKMEGTTIATLTDYLERKK